MEAVTTGPVGQPQGEDKSGLRVVIVRDDELAQRRAKLAKRVEQLARLSLLPLDTPSIPDMRNFVKAEILRWGRVVQQAGIAGSE